MMETSHMNTMPDNFRSLMSDFTRDLTTTFPEYSIYWSKWGEEDVSDDVLQGLFDYCKTVYPERFFDILYKNTDIFKEDSDVNVYFLPKMSFRLLFHCEDVSDKTKEVLWNYLQLILLTTVGEISDKNSFGETMKMFEGIDSEMLHDKLKDTMDNMSSLFETMESTGKEDADEATGKEDADEATDSSDPNLKEGFKNMFENMEDMKKKFPFAKMKGMPDIGKLQDHLQTLFDGKIGRLAKDLAEEVADDFKDILGGNPDNIENPQEVIKKLIKNPAKMSNLMKTVSSKLDAKLKTGEFSREDIMKEASEMMNKMQGEGGDMAEMFKNMAKSMGGLGKNMRFDQGAFDRMTKLNAKKDRMRENAMQSKVAAAAAEAQKQREYQDRVEKQRAYAAKYSLNAKDDKGNLVFRLDGEESQSKSFANPDQISEMLMNDLLESERLEESKKAPQTATTSKKNKTAKKPESTGNNKQHQQAQTTTNN